MRQLHVTYICCIAVWFQYSLCVYVSVKETETLRPFITCLFLFLFFHNQLSKSFGEPFLKYPGSRLCGMWKQNPLAQVTWQRGAGRSRPTLWRAEAESVCVCSWNVSWTSGRPAGQKVALMQPGVACPLSRWNANVNIYRGDGRRSFARRMRWALRYADCHQQEPEVVLIPLEGFSSTTIDLMSGSSCETLCNQKANCGSSLF